MKHKPTAGIKNKEPKMHWAARLIIKYGTLSALCVLVTGFIPEHGSFLAVSIGKTAVSMFALSVIGGLMTDVIAQRKGMRE